MAVVESKAIVNITKVEMVTNETSPKTITWDTSSEAEYTPDISEGEETILRVKNKIMATNKTEDIQYGSTLTFTDNVFAMDVLELIDGGTVDSSTKAYTAPLSGNVVIRKTFTLNIYTEEKDTSGNITGYFKFSYPNCKGKPMKFSFKDGTFMTPEYTVTSRPPKGTAPFTITPMASLT